MSNTMQKIEEALSPRDLWAWAGWRLFKDGCRRKRNPNYKFEDLPEKDQIEDFKKFLKVYAEENERRSILST